MVLNYKVCFKDGIFKYDCSQHSSYIDISAKDIIKIYDILNRLDNIQKRAKKMEQKKIICKDFVIIFDFTGCFRIERASNWLTIDTEAPIIKKELSKYVKEYNKESIKNIIVKIKSLKKGSGNKIKEELK